MFLRRNASRPSRRGIVLLIVLAMLTLFAIAGLTFVLYADAASESARTNRGAETMAQAGLPDMDPTASFNLFMGQLIYGVTDPTAADPSGGASSLRGHSLAETMYGSYDSQGAVPSDVPYNGTGRLSFPETIPSTPPIPNQDEKNLINYMVFSADGGIIHDPGRYGFRNNQAAARAPYVGGQNAPYTYPDFNSMFLATLNPSTGQVTTRSYDRGGAGNHYQSLRPLPGDMGPGFPLPTGSGDVQNLIGYPGANPVNDSIWIDVGAPELTTANGIRYKMLVAPLILDLDNRINLNVAGNVLATVPTAPNQNAHASNQGLGPWEVNIGKVLNAELFPPPHNPAIPPAPATEWQNLFNGNPPTAPSGAVLRTGRYGPTAGNPNRLPTSWFGLGGPTPHPYAPGDLDALINTNNNPNNPNETPYSVTGSGNTGPYTLPTIGQGFFPNFDQNAYLNGQMPEHQNASNPPQYNHPMYFNFMNPSAGNRLLSLGDYGQMLWAGVNASPNADLRVLCPTNFLPLDATPGGTTRRMHQTTVLSMDPDWPGVSPYTWDPGTASATYNLLAGNLYPTSPGNTFQAGPPPPVPVPPAPPVPPGSDFNSTTYRSTLSTRWPTLGRLELNRALAPYPANGVQPPDRQQFAMDIFNRLVAVTGMSGVAANPSDPSVTKVQYDALRWLAQLSANIVDYIDTDDVMTMFTWTTSPNGTFGDTTGIVFGTELPKLVVNEVYLEYDNDPADPTQIPNLKPPPATIPGATNKYHMYVWAELLNPLPTTAEIAPNPANNATLTGANGPVYQLVVTSPNTHLRDTNNIAGDPDGAAGSNPPFATQPYTPTGTPNGMYSTTVANSGAGQVLAVVNSWGGVQSVSPVGTNQNTAPGANSFTQGFLVVGPGNPPAYGGQAPTTQTQMPALTVTANNMMYTVANNDLKADQPAPPTLLLQRLANPNLAWNATPGPNYNPFVTVDYVDMQKVATATSKTVIQDARQYNSKGTNPNWVSLPNNRASFGRNQPYAAAAATGTATWQKQTFVTPPNPPNQQPATSFFAVNNPASVPDWLVHLDRPLISPAELLQVSGFKPHELTQQFVDPNNINTKCGQRAPWADQNSRIYRLLEFVKASNANAAMFLAPAGRVPGKVNINTLDANGAKEVFEALADAEPGNSFYNSSGTGTTDANVDAALQALITARNQYGPFWGLAPGAYQGNTPNAGLLNTMLPSLASTGTNTHPYQQSEMLTKLFSNLTTRSNVFAVWLTVGFFQVTNDQVQPMMLGAEINAAQHRNIRHHMFAIVDRTQIQTFSTSTLAGTNITPGNAGISIPNPITDPATRTGRTWTVAQGSVLVYEPNTPNEETVLVGAGNTALFTKAHSGVVPVVSRGNPGPWTKYDASLDTGANGVVPYYKIID